MGKKIRITRKTLKQDEVRSYGLQIYHWLEGRYKPLLMGIGAAALVLLAVQIRSCNKAQREAEANFLLTNAQGDITLGLFAKDEGMREEKLASAEENLAKIPRKSKTGPYALYLLGNIAFFRNDYDEAERYFRQYLDTVTDRTEKADGYIALGYTYENQYFWTAQSEVDRMMLDRALESYLEAENLTSGTMQHYLAMLGQARLYDLRPDRVDQAKELYKRIERERQLPPINPGADVDQNPNEWMLARMEEMRRLFTLAETAKLRLEQLEAGE